MNRIWSFSDNAVDTIKGLSIVFIVFYHIHSISTYLSFIIESIALPAFMFVSGVLYFRHTRNRRIPTGGKLNFFYKKVLRLLVPYFVIGLLYTVFKGLFFYLSAHQITFDYHTAFINLLVNPRLSFAPFIWFLSTLFFIFIIVHFVSDSYMWILVAFSIPLYLFYHNLPTQFCIQDIAHYLMYFMGGFVVLKYNGRIERVNSVAIVLQNIFLLVYVTFLDLISDTIIGRGLSYLGKYSGSIYLLHPFCVAMFTVLLGENYWVIIGIFSIMIPMLIDYFTHKMGWKVVRKIFLGK